MIIIVGWALCVPKFASSPGGLCGKRTFLSFLMRLGCEEPEAMAGKKRSWAQGRSEGGAARRSGTQTARMGLACNVDTAYSLDLLCLTRHWVMCW